MDGSYALNPAHPIKLTINTEPSAKRIEPGDMIEYVTPPFTPLVYLTGRREMMLSCTHVPLLCLSRLMLICACTLQAALSTEMLHHPSISCIILRCVQYLLVDA